MEKIGRGVGSITLTVDNDTTTIEAATKSATEEIVFAIDIVTSNGAVLKHIDDHRTVSSEPVMVREGSYTLKAYTGDMASAAFDSPFYEGETSVDVKSGTNTAAEIICSMANVMCSVEYDDKVREMFSSYNLTVSNTEASLTFEGDDVRKGYFSPTGTLQWNLTLTNVDGERFDTLGGTISDVKPKEHYRFRFGVDTERDGASAIMVTIDELTNDREVNVDVVIGKPHEPVLSGSDFSIEEGISLPYGMLKERSVVYAVAGGLSKAVVSFAEFEGMDIPVYVDMLSLSSADSLALKEAGIVWEGFEQSGKVASLEISSFLSRLQIGSYKMYFATADNERQLVYDTLAINIIPNVDVMAHSASPWAMFATLKGEWLSELQPSGMGFEYRASDEQEWSRVDVISVDESSKTFTANIYMLSPDTKYYFRTFSDNDAGKESPSMSFVTESAGVIPNMNFDSWYKSGKTWYPKAGPDETTWWDTANSGANILSENNPTSPESSFLAVSGEGKNAARLETKSVLGVMAAGNLYTGQFKSLSGTTAKLDFGVPFTSRPVGLKGYYCYTPKIIDKVQSPYEHLKGQTDYMQIYLMLTDWDTPFAVSSDGTFVSMDDPAIIAYGEIVSQENTNGQYVPFKIKLDYRDTTRQPKYAVIICCASRYGDYFTGAIGSVLYVDEFEMIYDPLEFQE